MNPLPWSAVFTRYAGDKLAQNLRQIVRCVELLSTEELWRRSNEHCNSVGNLVLHLTGNVSQWIDGGLGGAAVQRDRIAEFAARGPLAAGQIVPPLVTAVENAQRVIAGLDEAALCSMRRIQAYDVTGQTAVFHVVEHFSFHTGQIVHITKAIKDVDLSLYDTRGHKREGGNVTP